MCGIAGILSSDYRLELNSSIKSMTNAMQHRGPNSEGFYTDHGNITFGHRRLAIIDLSDRGRQPLIDHSGRYVITFNGEIYNYKEIREEIKSYPFGSDSDSEVLLAAFSIWGIDCINRLKGMFAFAIWDKDEKSLYIVRDRLGVKPLYYYQSLDCFLFASEIRSLLASGLVPRRLSKEGLYEFLSFQSIGVPGSIIEGVKQLRPGSYLKIVGGKLEEVLYWDITKRKPSFDYNDIPKTKKHIYSLLYHSVERRMVSDVPVGAFLSGGIDSSAIVALMSQFKPGKPNTFTASFDEAAFDESYYASLIAKKFKTNHANIKLKSQTFLDEMQNALDAMDSPSGDGINTYVISKAIKQAGISVALSGLGGDELFAGYPTFSFWSKLENARPVWPVLLPLRKCASAILDYSRSGRLNRMGELLNQQKINIHTVYPALRRMLPQNQLKKLLKHINPAKAGFEYELEGQEMNIGRLPVLSQMTIAELKGFTQNTLLKDTDQMSMAVSLEIREPFFDSELIEFVLNIPDKIKKPVFPKSLLVQSLENLLPDEIVHRKKQGFVFPWAIWLKGELREFGSTYIENMSRRSFINSEALLDLWRRFLKGDKHARWSDVWLFIVLEYWLEKNQVDV